LAEEDKLIEKLTNFSGSNATVLVTPDKGYLWTDSRYYIQAERELEKENWEMIPMEDKERSWHNLIHKNKYNVKTDFKNVSYSAFEEINKKYKGLSISHLDDEIVRKVIEEQKSFENKKSQIFILGEEFSGQSTLEKYKSVSESILCEYENEIGDIRKSRVSLVISKLDDIACINNVNILRVDKFKRK
jgi:Xaa-Pro aminopeptidase